MKREYWKASRDHEGETIVIVGGGPSLIDFDFESLRSFTTIAVNNAWEKIPWSEYCFFGDKRWWTWNKEKLIPGFKNKIVTSTHNFGDVKHPRLKRMKLDHHLEISLQPDTTVGADSGTKAINLAFHLGASRILLAGMDMKPAPNGATHFHNDHKIPTILTSYDKRFAPKMTKLVRQLNSRNVEVFRITEPGLDCIPFRSLSEFMG